MCRCFAIVVKNGGRNAKRSWILEASIYYFPHRMDT